MFRCDICSLLQPARTPSHKLPVQTRPRTYLGEKPKYDYAKKYTNPEPRERGIYHGTEIVREAVVCPACLPILVKEERPL